MHPNWGGAHLKEYESLLDPQSHLVNFVYFDHFIKADGGNTILMQDKRYRSAFFSQKR